MWQTPRARLAVRARHLAEADTRAHVAARFAVRGIDAGRLDLGAHVPYDELLEAYRGIDIDPNDSGLPGIAQLRTLVGAVMTIGLILSVTLQFAAKSLVSWPQWLIFAATYVWVGVLKKNSLWAILATIMISLLLLN